MKAFRRVPILVLWSVVVCRQSNSTTALAKRLDSPARKTWCYRVRQSYIASAMVNGRIPYQLAFLWNLFDITWQMVKIGDCQNFCKRYGFIYLFILLFFSFFFPIDLRNSITLTNYFYSTFFLFLNLYLYVSDQWRLVYWSKLLNKEKITDTVSENNYSCCILQKNQESLIFSWVFFFFMYTFLTFKNYYTYMLQFVGKYKCYLVLIFINFMQNKMLILVLS